MNANEMRMIFCVLMIVCYCTKMFWIYSFPSGAELVFVSFGRSWDHHDNLSVQPEYNVSSRCSTSARLISIAPYSGRKETSVYATDLHTGATIRCKVFIDKISRIQIFHHAVKIDLDELVTLRIRGFDIEGNLRGICNILLVIVNQNLCRSKLASNAIVRYLTSRGQILFYLSVSYG